jgi:hypothetical protein
MYWNYMLKGHVWFPKHNTAFRGMSPDDVAKLHLWRSR